MSRLQRTTTTAATWRDVWASLDTLDRVGLIALVPDLYNVDALNRRVLHARFAQDSATFGQYRRLVRAAVFPDPLSQRPIRLRDATATIREYQRATGDLTGVVDLMRECRGGRDETGGGPGGTATTHTSARSNAW